MGPKREVVTGNVEEYITRRLKICIPHQILFERSNQEECDRRDMKHVWKKEVQTRVEWGNMKGRGHLKDLDLNGRIILKRIFKKWDGGMDWIVLAEDGDRVVGSCCECLIEYSDSVNYASNFLTSGFGGLGVSCWPLVPKFAGSNAAEDVGFLGRKNPQHVFLRRGSKAVGPMS